MVMLAAAVTRGGTGIAGSSPQEPGPQWVARAPRFDQLRHGRCPRRGRFLGPSIRDFYERHPVSRIVEDWHEAGLRDVVVLPMSLGGGIVMSATKAQIGRAHV